MLGRFDGDRELARDIVAIGLEQIPAEFERLEAALLAADLAAAKRSTHTLKGLVAQVGGASLAHTLQQADKGLAHGETIGVAAVAAWREEFGRLITKLRERDYL